jgi:dTDP-glucose pyrophosphorylase
MTNLLILLGGKGTRMSKYGVPKPFIKIKDSYLFEIAISSAIKFLRNPKKHMVISIENYQYAEANNVNLNVDSLFVLPLETSGPAESARLTVIENDEPFFVVDCDLYFQIPHENADDLPFDCKLFFFSSNNPGHSFLIEEDGIVLALAEKEQISEKGVVGIYGFRNKKYFDSLFDATNFRGEKFMSTVIKTAIENNDRVIASICDAHLPLGTGNELDANIDKFGFFGI